MFSLADSNFYYLSFFMNTVPVHPPLYLWLGVKPDTLPAMLRWPGTTNTDAAHRDLTLCCISRWADVLMTTGTKTQTQYSDSCNTELRSNISLTVNSNIGRTNVCIVQTIFIVQANACFKFNANTPVIHAV